MDTSSWTRAARYGESSWRRRRAWRTEVCPATCSRRGRPPPWWAIQTARTRRSSGPSASRSATRPRSSANPSDCRTGVAGLARDLRARGSDAPVGVALSCGGGRSRSRECERPPPQDRATPTGASLPRARRSRARPATPVRQSDGLAELRGLVADRDALGPELLRVRAVWIAHHGGGRPRLEHVAGQTSVLHARRRRQDDSPYLAARVQLDVSMGVLVAGLQDGAGERHLLAGVVAAPPVMAERRAGERGHHGHGERESQSDAHVLPRFQFALTSEGLRRPATVKPSPRGLRTSISPSVGKRAVWAVMLTWCVMRRSVPP